LTFTTARQASLSVFRGAGAVSGLLATLVFPRLHAAAGLETAGCAGISWLNACLLVGAVPTIAASILGAPLGGGGAGRPPPLLLLLLCGLVASRLGVWLFDLAVSQLQQELVPADELGERGASVAVGGFGIGAQDSIVELGAAPCGRGRPSALTAAAAAAAASAAPAVVMVPVLPQPTPPSKLPTKPTQPKKRPPCPD
jgi:hypothetical protein